MRALEKCALVLLVMFAATIVRGADAQTSIPLGQFDFRTTTGRDQTALELVAPTGATFARTFVPTAELSAIEASCAEFDGELETEAVVALTSGAKFVFSSANDAEGFVRIEYVMPTEGRLKNEEPLVWETPCFAPDSFGSLKAFGTAGLRPVDGHKGSYAFLSLVDPETRFGVVGGWLTSEKAGGVVMSGKGPDGVPTMTPRLDYGDYENKGRELSEYFLIGPFDDCRIGLEHYADAIARWYKIEPNLDALVGYCTWYAEKNGGACDENAMKELSKALIDNFGAYGLQFVQIDDRWQKGASKNGPNKDFTGHAPNGPYPSGMKATSQELNDKGLIAGLWFMPFAGNFDDPYFADKQDLFVRSAIDYPAPGEKNTRRFSMINQKKGAPYETYWGGTALDMSNPKTCDYVASVVDRITQEWNYKYIKIDGMWVGSALEQLYVNDEYLPDDMGLQIFFDPTRTNVENFRTGLQLVRDHAKDTFILGCNVSQNMRIMASSYGLVDAMRVGPDNGADWNGVCAGPQRGTNRYFYNGRVWRNDPDPVYVRTSIPIERARVSASWAAITGQLYALSDWVPDYDQARIDLVRKTIPNHGSTDVRPVDLFDEDLARVWLLTDARTGVRRDVLALFNWHGEDGTTIELTPEKIGLPTEDENGDPIEKYVAYEFWTDEFVGPFDVFKTSLAKESCKVFAIQPVGKRPVLLSSSRHVAQCVLDVKSERWNAETQKLTIVAELPADFEYELRVYDPTKDKLVKWTAPKDKQGETTFEYDTQTETFRVVD